MGQRVLIHICCGICAIEPVRALREEGFALKGLFYNPNIHPFMEFQKRLKAAKIAAERLELEVSFDENYGLIPFLRSVVVREAADFSPRARCEICYRMRLERTAELAANDNFAFFTTTLLSSPHQDQELLCIIGEEVGTKFGAKFLYRDMRTLHEESKRKAKKMSLYSQNYCGCIFSEFERYRDRG
jgi:predicted adenine nucleotide alpha hydrolase (AANH) superfamily ATPase